MARSYAVATVLLSVAGNGYHAFGLANVRLDQPAAGIDVGYDPQPAKVAAFIATIAPLLFLALMPLFTLMLRAIVNERARYLRVVSEHLQREKESAERCTTVDDQLHAPTDLRPDGCNELAAPNLEPQPTIAPTAYPFDPGEMSAPGHDALPAAIASELKAMHELHTPRGNHTQRIRTDRIRLAGLPCELQSPSAGEGSRCIAPRATGSDLRPGCRDAPGRAGRVHRVQAVAPVQGRCHGRRLRYSTPAADAVHRCNCCRHGRVLGQPRTPPRSRNSAESRRTMRAVT